MEDPQPPETSFGACRGMQDGKSRSFEERIGKEKRRKKGKRKENKRKEQQERLLPFKAVEKHIWLSKIVPAQDSSRKPIAGYSRLKAQATKLRSVVALGGRDIKEIANEC